MRVRLRIHALPMFREEGEGEQTMLQFEIRRVLHRNGERMRRL